jgi:hypothetical protein
MNHYSWPCETDTEVDQKHSYTMCEILFVSAVKNFQDYAKLWGYTLQIFRIQGMYLDYYLFKLQMGFYPMVVILQ